MAVRESPEIAAVVLRVGEAWAARDFNTFSNLISKAGHFRGIGTDADEVWDSAEEFLGVRRVQSEELDGRGLDDVGATVERLDAFEDGNIGWASMQVSIETPSGVVPLRATMVLAMEAGVWRIVQWHGSVPTPNMETFGVELTTTLDELLESVAEDSVAMETLAAEGTRILAFTDIVDSTPLAERLGDAGWLALIEGHEAGIRRITSTHGGTVIKMLGDGSMLAFTSARAAVRAALDIQQSTAGEGYVVRIGIHAGEVMRKEGDMLGTAVNKAARVASAAVGGEVLVSALVAELTGTMDGIEYGPERNAVLKGLTGVHTLMPARFTAEPDRFA